MKIFTEYLQLTESCINQIQTLMIRNNCTPKRSCGTTATMSPYLQHSPVSQFQDGSATPSEMQTGRRQRRKIKIVKNKFPLYRPEDCSPFGAIPSYETSNRGDVTPLISPRDSLIRVTALKPADQKRVLYQQPPSVQQTQASTPASNDRHFSNFLRLFYRKNHANEP